MLWELNVPIISVTSNSIKCLSATRRLHIQMEMALASFRACIYCITFLHANTPKTVALSVLQHNRGCRYYTIRIKFSASVYVLYEIRSIC